MLPEVPCMHLREPMHLVQGMTHVERRKSFGIALRIVLSQVHGETL